MARRLEMDHQDHLTLKARCAERGILFLSSPFDEPSVDFLSRVLGLETLKIPSGEITNAPLLLRAARTGCAIILSTGMSTTGEIEDARSAGIWFFGEKRLSRSFRAHFL